MGERPLLDSAPPPTAANPPGAPADAARPDAAAAPVAISPRICEIFCALLLLILALAPNSLINTDGDVAQHLAVGHLILNGPMIPRDDIFSHAHLGQPFLDWEWLSEAIYAAVDTLFGLNGVAILAAALLAGSLYGLCRWMMARGLHPLLAFLLALLTTVASEIHWLARPHLFSLPLLLLTMWLLDEYRRGRLPARRLALIPLLTVFWANVHPGFIFGLVTCGAYLAGTLAEWAILRYVPPGTVERIFRRARPFAETANQPAPGTQVRAYGLTLVAAALAALINPYGWQLYVHIWINTGSPTTALIAEFQHPDLRQPITWGFVVLLVGMLIVLWRTWRRVPPAHLALLAGWTYLAIQAARNILQFSFVVPALLAPRLAELVNAHAGRGRGGAVLARYRLAAPPRQGPPWILAGTLGVLLILAALGGRVGNAQILRAQWTEPPFPKRAVQFVQANPQMFGGKMFNYIIWGGYLIGTLHPQHLIFISTQQDAYGETLNADYRTIENTGPGWETLLARYDAGWVIERPDVPLVEALRKQPDRWQVVYEDRTAVILLRRAIGQ
jgi:hypothetical protein